VFCHVSGLKEGNMLQEGDEVEFEVVFDDRQNKYRAMNVTGGIQDRSRERGGGGGGGRDRYDGGRDRQLPEPWATILLTFFPNLFFL